MRTMTLARRAWNTAKHYAGNDPKILRAAESGKRRTLETHAKTLRIEYNYWWHMACSKEVSLEQNRIGLRHLTRLTFELAPFAPKGEKNFLLGSIRKSERLIAKRNATRILEQIENDPVGVKWWWFRSFNRYLANAHLVEDKEALAERDALRERARSAREARRK